MASEKITAIVESVKTMTVLELKELVDTICEEFGVSAVAAAAPAAAEAVEYVEIIGAVVHGDLAAASAAQLEAALRDAGGRVVAEDKIHVAVVYRPG